LSVGESLSWPEDLKKGLNWPVENFLMIDRVQDNGVDPLWAEFERCLKFIGELLDYLVLQHLANIQKKQASATEVPPLCTAG
jgi:hypothetical protein